MNTRYILDGLAVYQPGDYDIALTSMVDDFEGQDLDDIIARHRGERLHIVIHVLGFPRTRRDHIRAAMPSVNRQLYPFMMLACYPRILEERIMGYVAAWPYRLRDDDQNLRMTKREYLKAMGWHPGWWLDEG